MNLNENVDIRIVKPMPNEYNNKLAKIGFSGNLRI